MMGVFTLQKLTNATKQPAVSPPGGCKHFTTVKMNKGKQFLGYVDEDNGQGEIEKWAKVEDKRLGGGRGEQCQGLSRPQVSPCQVGTLRSWRVWDRENKVLEGSLHGLR